MSQSQINAAIVGCGNIAKAYAERIATYDCLRVKGFFDLDPARAKVFAEAHGGQAYPSLDAVLADAEVDLVVNLTIHHAHYETLRQCLEAGKPAYTEKPMALSYAEAKELVELAEARGLRLASAPSTFLGEACETLAEQLGSGRAGRLRLAYAEMNHGRIETWHPNPAPFYGVGPVWDVAIYPLTVWAALCGPAKRVRAVGQTLMPERRALDGSAFALETPDCVVACLEFANGMLGRLTANFYAKPSKQGSSMEFHGDKGTFFLGSCARFDAPLEYAPFGGAYEPVELLRPGYPGTEYARGAKDFAEALLEDRPHRCNARRAAHVVEVIEAIHASAKEERPVELLSRF